MSEEKLPGLWLSASQIKTFDLCIRKWWFLSRMKLPVIKKDHFKFGTILHEVVERYLNADDVGKDKSGSPVDLHPEGWAEGIDVADAALIKILVRAAIEEGVIERWPRRRIEHEFSRVFDGFVLTGFIDVLLPDSVIDHKTTKNMRYAKSESGLKKDLQMLIYAGELLMQCDEKKTPPPEVLTLRHNVFLKEIRGKTMIRKTEALVTPDFVESFWEEEVMPRCGEMVAVDKVFDEKDNQAWKDLPLPENTNQACNAFGGCPFMSVCHRGENIPAYRDRLDMIGKREVESR